MYMCYYTYEGTGSWNPPAQISGGGTGSSSYGGTDKCPRCGKSVYMAEKIVGAGSVCNKISLHEFNMINVNLAIAVLA